MKLLYLTIPSFLDLEISLIRELSKYIDVTVIMIVSPQSRKASAFDIDEMPSLCDIYQAKNYPYLDKYSNMIDLDKWYIANNPNNSILSSIKLSRKINHFFNHNNFDFLHTTTACKTALAFLPFASTIKNTLFTLHDPISHQKLSWIKDFINRRIVFACYKNLLLLSDAHVNSFCKQYNYNKENIYYSRLSTYDFLTHYPIKENPYGDFILFFGRVEPYKGINILLEAYQKGNFISKGIKLIIAGKGSLKESVYPKGIVRINHFLSNEELANLIYHCRFVVLPYISATQSGCIMSAYAFNKPVLATRVGDFPEEIEENKTGLLCNANDVNDLTKQMMCMCTIKKNSMSKEINSKYACEGPYSWNSIAKKLVETYKKISG